jgi:hypothetical protein
MRVRHVSAGMLAICLGLATAACGSNDTEAGRSSEDSGMAPDTTATEPNAITPGEGATPAAATPSGAAS